MMLNLNFQLRKSSTRKQFWDLESLTLNFIISCPSKILPSSVKAHVQNCYLTLLCFSLLITCPLPPIYSSSFRISLFVHSLCERRERKISRRVTCGPPCWPPTRTPYFWSNHASHGPLIRLMQEIRANRCLVWWGVYSHPTQQPYPTLWRYAHCRIISYWCWLAAAAARSIRRVSPVNVAEGLLRS